MSKRCFVSQRFGTSALYSPAVISGGLVYFSGMGPTDPQTGVIVSQDFGKQVIQVIENLLLLLDEMGLSRSDIVKTNIYLADIRNFAAFNEIYAPYFKESLPARTTIQAAGLPNGIQVEIELVADAENCK